MYGEINEGFESLIGKEHKFYGVDNYCFKLGNRIFEAVEDESDGYRSYLGSVELIGDPKGFGLIFPRYSFARVRLEESYSGCDFEGYQIVDLDDGHVWLRFGTEHAWDYYPVFVYAYSAKPA